MIVNVCQQRRRADFPADLNTEAQRWREVTMLAQQKENVREQQDFLNKNKIEQDIRNILLDKPLREVPHYSSRAFKIETHIRFTNQIAATSIAAAAAAAARSSCSSCSRAVKHKRKLCRHA
jgi:hypothetical protein